MHTVPNSKLTIEEIKENLYKAGEFSLDYAILIVTSASIASLGLLLNSTAIIIGAMIIAPLMDPILSVAFLSIYSQKKLLSTAVGTLIFGTALALIVSIIFGVLFSGVGITTEILARTKPNIMDLLVALMAGALGALVKIRRSLKGTIAGVAIAISLMPPLCSAGIGIASGKPDIYTGAFLLFFTNVSNILLSGFIVFLTLEVPYLKKSLKTLIFPLSMSALMLIPLVYNFVSMTQEKKLNFELKGLLQQKTSTFKNVRLTKVEVNSLKKPMLVTITVGSTNLSITPNQVTLVEKYLSEKINRPIHLVVIMTPIIQITGSDYYYQ